MGRLDYTPWSPFILYPASKADGKLEYLKEIQIERNLENIPIVALADLHSVSMGEQTPMAICSLPNGCFIGETTWGGHGVLTDDFNDTYGGAFVNSAFYVHTTTSHTKNIDGTIYEGIGLTPDIEALYNEEAFMQGNDTQLERAIQYIQTGKWSFLSVASINTNYQIYSTINDGGVIVSPAKFSTVININKLNNQQMKKQVYFTRQRVYCQAWHYAYPVVATMIP